MDPKPLTNLDWNNIRVVVQTLWIVLVSVVVFGGAFLTAQVFLPALATANVQRDQLKYVRLFLYFTAGASFTVAVFLVIKSFDQISLLLSSIYARFWM